MPMKTSVSKSVPPSHVSTVRMLPEGAPAGSMIAISACGPGVGKARPPPVALQNPVKPDMYCGAAFESP